MSTPVEDAVELAQRRAEVAALRAQNQILIAQAEALRSALAQSRNEVVQLSLALAVRDPDGAVE